MVYLKYDRRIIELKDQIRIGKAGSNDLVVPEESIGDFHAIILKSGSKIVLITSGLNDTSGSGIILGELLLIKGSTRVRLEGSLIEIQKKEGWIHTRADKDNECPICKMRIKTGEPVWQCQNCGVMVHAVEFCRPRSEFCFRCGR